MLSPSGTLQKTFQGSGLEGFAHVGRKGEHGSAEDTFLGPGCSGVLMLRLPSMFLAKLGP